MATDLYKIVKYNDGEGITYGDLDDTNRFLAAKLSDQLFEKLVGSPGYYSPEVAQYEGPDTSTNYAYALTVGGAVPMQGSTTSKIRIGAGTIFQKVGTADGNNSTFLTYTFDGTDELTISAGHATLNRVDMVQMKLELVSADSQTRDFKDATTGVITSNSMSKKQRVQCTLSVKSGTAATNPAYPSPDAGYVPLCCVVVGATWAGAERMYYEDIEGARAMIHDLRMPLSIKKHRAVMSAGWGYSSGWAWSASTQYWYCTTANAEWLGIPCHAPVGRLIAVSCESKNDVAGADGFILTANQYRLADVTTALLNASTTVRHKTAKLSDIEATPRFDDRYDGGALSYTISGNGTHGLPIWTNGKRGVDPRGEIYSGNETIESGTGYRNANPGLDLTIEARDDASPQQYVYQVDWYVAEGL